MGKQENFWIIAILSKVQNTRMTGTTCLGTKLYGWHKGCQGVTTAQTCYFFIDKGKVPPDRWWDITQGKIVCTLQPQKVDVNRTRLTMGGDRINMYMDCGTPTANLLTVKLLFNSIVSTPGEIVLGLDLKDFYLKLPWIVLSSYA